MQQLREGGDARRATWRALIDGRIAGSDGLGIRQTSRIATACALRLGQYSIDTGGEVFQVTLIPGAAPVSGDSRYSPSPVPLAHSTMPSDTPNFILRGARFAT